MTATDLRNARIRLGLSVREFAAAITDPARTAAGMPSVAARTVRHWENDEWPVPEFVEDRIGQLLAATL